MMIAEGSHYGKGSCLDMLAQFELFSISFANSYHDIVKGPLNFTFTTSRRHAYE